MEVTAFSEIEKEFIERVHQMVWCNVATLDTRSRLRSRLMHPIWEGARGWIGSRRHTLKARHLAHNPYVSLAYIADVARPVYVDCIAEWKDDLASKQHVWELYASAAPPLGFDYGTIFASAAEPEFGLLKLTPWRIELADMMNQENRKVWRNPGA
jgi:general stress protein 26